MKTKKKNNIFFNLLTSVIVTERQKILPFYNHVMSI